MLIIKSCQNLSEEEIHKIKCKYRQDDKKCETCETKYKYSDSFVEYINLKDDLIECKCLYCNNNYQQKFDEKLKELFFWYIQIF